MSSTAEEAKILTELQSESVEKPKLTEAEIVDKYDKGQARIIVQRNDFLLPNLIQMVSDKDVMNLSPEYQRRKRWNDTKKSHLIESLLMNIPIPAIFLYEIDLARYEVMDGQQRLETIRSFMKNEFKLKDLKLWPELDGRTFSDLPLRIQRGLERRGISAMIILTESGKSKVESFEIRQYVFERLNTGGEKLNRQEVRNCIYASEFNNTLNHIAREAIFTDVWEIPPKEPDEPYKVTEKLSKNNLYSTMSDCEIVLRFFAFADMNKFAGSVKRTLDLCMIRNQGISRADCKQLQDSYIKHLKTAHDIYGDKLFRLVNNKTQKLGGRKSIPLSDAVLLAIAQLAKHANLLVSKRNEIISKTEELLKNHETYEILIGRGNTKSSIADRINLVYESFKTVCQVS